MKRVLVVDDEPAIARVARDYLDRAGFSVTVAATAREALDAARRERPDLVVLDLGLPDGDGLDVARALRTTSNVPLIILTARGEETDRIVGLEGVIDGVYPADREHLEPLLDQTRVLSRLIEDLRVLSLAESGALTLHRETTDLGELVEDTAAAFRAQAASAGVTLAVDAAAPLPETEIDSVRIQEVVSNLLANALRYTPAGGRIDVAVTAEGGAQRVEIRDTGAGIARDALAHVFDRFWKSGDSRGSGLGLAIAKGLVAAHGGEISVTSEGPGRGTTVRFSLPARP